MEGHEFIVDRDEPIRRVRLANVGTRNNNSQSFVTPYVDNPVEDLLPWINFYTTSPNLMTWQELRLRQCNGIWYQPIEIGYAKGFWPTTLDRRIDLAAIISLEHGEFLDVLPIDVVEEHGMTEHRIIVLYNTINIMDAHDETKVIMELSRK